MEIYLPIAEMPVDVLVLLGLGALVGVLSGAFGVGGGFLLTPALIFLGIPAAVAVGTQANQLVGASVAGVIGHLRRGGVDMRMGAVLLAGGLVGAVPGVVLFAWLRRLGQIDLAISVLYVVMLGAVGLLMLRESVGKLRGRTGGGRRATRLHDHHWMHGLPFKIKFSKSRLYISALVPLSIGALGGFIVSLLGVGGGFFMVPAMIYWIGMPTAMVAGTSLFQIVFITAISAFLHAAITGTVDVMLALLLLAGGVVGVHIGTKLAAHLRGEQSRALLALLVLAVAVALLADLLLTPDQPFTVGALRLPEGRA